MRIATSKWSLTVLLVAVCSVVYSGVLSAQAKTATEFYTDYLGVFAKAKSVDQLLPYMSASRRKEIESTPAGERAKMFEFIKMVQPTGVKVLKEEKTATGATLTTEGVDSDKKKMTGTVVIVREGGAWKIQDESWKS